MAVFSEQAGGWCYMSWVGHIFEAARKGVWWSAEEWEVVEEAASLVARMVRVYLLVGVYPEARLTITVLR